MNSAGLKISFTTTETNSDRQRSAVENQHWNNQTEDAHQISHKYAGHDARTLDPEILDPEIKVSLEI